MGDISELRGLVLAGCFITFFILIGSLIPPQFFEQETTYRQVEVPEYFDAISLSAFNSTWASNIDNGTYKLGNDGKMWWFQDINFGDQDIDLATNKDLPTPISNIGWIRITRYDYFWIFVVGWHNFEWYNSLGEPLGEVLTGTMINEAYADSELTLKFTATLSGSGSIQTFFEFNTSEYLTPYEAWESDELYVFTGSSMQQTQTSLNAWDMLVMLLFWGIPGVNVYVDFFIHVPIWICMAYISFILILRVIGAIFGGGA